MKSYLEDYKKYLTDVKKSSGNTLDAYVRDVKQFLEYCEMNGAKSISSINSDYVNKYIDYLNFMGKSSSTKSRIIASLRGFFKYLISVDLISNNPALSVKIEGNKRKLPDILDSKEIMQLLSAPSGKDYKGIRDKAMLELLYATGIKVSEIIELKVSDVNLQIGILHTKQANERIIPIYQTALQQLKEYIFTVRPILVQSEREEHLFVNMTGQPMSRQGFWKIIKSYSQKAGIRKDITPHTLRHSFAAHLLENGAQLSDIKEMLGHSDISSTQIYAQVVKSKYMSSYTKFHPLANK